jgi:hypothetical protein
MNKNQFGKPITPHIQNQMNTNMYNNFQQAYTPNTPLIAAYNDTNYKQVLHNNLAEKLFNERIVEYRAIIHSNDRDRGKFPSPFKMQVSFGNTNVQPNLEEYLTNIKYITLNNIWVPRTIAINTSKIDIYNKEYDIFPTNICSNDIDNIFPYENLGYHPFLILKVKELDNKHFIGTSPYLQRDTFTVVLDQCFGNMLLFKPKRSSIVYSNSSLKNLSLFTLHLLDEKGQDINIIDQTGKKIIGQNINEEIPYDLNKYIELYNENKNVKYTDDTLQVIYDFTFGIIENELNTLTSYNKL